MTPSVFFSYSHVDEGLRDQLETQLALLKRQSVIATWHDRRIGAGEELNGAIDDHINSAGIILLLVSADFIASDYCYDREMARAMERHEAGEAIVIPVILRACDWHGAPFGKLMATPIDGRPVTQWPDRDQALLEVAKAVRGAAERLARGSGGRQRNAADVVRVSPPLPAAQPAPVVRSSNLRVAKQFSERDKDRFREQAFDFISLFFENSLLEIASRNPEIETNFRRIDANRFMASAYRGGHAVSKCTVYVGGGHFGGGIAYVYSETMDSHSFNESLRVEVDDQSIFLKSLGMARYGQADQKLSFEGAAELYWSLFVEPLQRH